MPLIRPKIRLGGSKRRDSKAPHYEDRDASKKHDITPQDHNAHKLYPERKKHAKREGVEQTADDCW